MDRWKAEQGRGREKSKIRRKEDGDARKGRKVAKHCVFPMICGSGGSKSRLAKAAGAELKIARRCGAKQISKSKCTKYTSVGPLLEVEMSKSARRCGAKHICKSKCRKHLSSGPLLEVAMSKKCTPLWREAHFQVKMYKTHHCRTTFGSSDVEKVHAVVALSTFPSQNVQNTPGSDHFWKFRCRKSARRCGAKHISKSKCTKHHMFAPLLEVRMSKKCTPLWREGHFEVKMLKTPWVRTTFGGSDVASLQYTTLQDITLHYTPVHYITLHYTPVHSTTLNYTTPHYITLNDTATQIDR